MSAVILGFIEAGDAKRLEFTLSTVEPTKLGIIKSIDLLGSCLNSAKKAEAKRPIVEVIFNGWSKTFKTNDVKSMLAVVAGLYVISDDVYKYVAGLFPEVSVYAILEAALMMESILFFGAMANRVIASASVKCRVEWSSLLSLAKTKGKQDAVAFIENRMLKIMPEAKKPDWVSIREIETKLNLDTFDFTKWTSNGKDVPKELATDHTVAELQKAISGLVIAKDDEGKKIQSAVLNNVIKAAVSIGPTCADGAAADPDRIFGPINAIMGRECISSISGGCRMFTCICRDCDQELDEEPDLDSSPDWFTGNCDGCLKKIGNISHALRFPVGGGGFVGCFCCEKCMETKTPRILDTAAHARLECLYNALASKGVLDRTALPK
jgi:hypothetical protein